MATLQSIEGIADEIKRLLEALLADFRQHRGSNAADFRKLWEELAKLKDRVDEFRQANSEEIHVTGYLEQLEKIVDRINRQEPSYVTLELILDQINAVKQSLKEDIDLFLEARLLRMRQGITEDITKAIDSSRMKEEKKRHRQIVAQTWIIGGITIVLGLLSILVTLAVSPH